MVEAMREWPRGPHEDESVKILIEKENESSEEFIINIKSRKK